MDAVEQKSAESEHGAAHIMTATFGHPLRGVRPEHLVVARGAC